MKSTLASTTLTESSKTEQVVISKLLKLLTQYKKDKNSLNKVFLCVRKLKKQKELELSIQLQEELQELEVLEETIDQGKITADKQHIVNEVLKEVVFTLKNIEKSLHNKK